MTPFFLDTGRHPCMGFEPQACPSENDSINKFVNQMRRAQEEAKAALVKAKEDMAWYYDRRWTPAPVYKPGDCLHQLHPVFNVVKLFPASKDPVSGCHPKPPPPPVLVNDEEEYEVEEILDSRVFQGKLQFKVKWKGYGIEDISWELQANVHAPGLVRDFYPDQAICDFFYLLFLMLLKPLKRHTWPREFPDLFSLDFPLPAV
ncbi:hypothetical protein E4T56_gene1192 [Termitomyces sp. T112]|nr:hypothetical protein E4T56_gene1192 [Termitomyces sp. T112]